MTDQLPYTYTDDEDVAVRVGPRVCTVYDRPGRTSVGFYTPAGEDAVRLARAVLAAAGDTGHRVVSVEDMSEGRVAAMRIAAEATFERAVEAMFALHGPGDESAQHYAEAIRALPLLPAATEDARTMRHCVLCASGDHQPSAHDDDTPVYESPQELVQEIEWLRAENTRLTRERDVAVRELGKALTAERAEHLDVKFDGTRRRVGALEQQYTDLANLVHGHGEDLARLRCRFTEEDDG